MRLPEREREREKRKPLEFSLTVIISTLRDGSGGVKKRRRRRRVKPNGGCCCRGPVVSCLLTPPHLSLTYTHTLHLLAQRMRGERGEKTERKGKENSHSDQTMSKWKWKEQEGDRRRGRKRSGFRPKYDKTSMNLKHEEGASGEKESQWLNPAVSRTHCTRVCVRVCVRACAGMRVALCNEF